MIQLYIFNNASKAANYGIGTYIRQLTYGLSQNGLYAITLVELYADVKDVSIEIDDNGIHHFRVPATSDSIESETYCRSVFYLIARHIGSNYSHVVFQFNYFQHVYLALLLKAQFPDCRILLTIHYLHWGFELNGSQARFEQIIDGAQSAKDDTAKRVLASFNLERSFMRLADEVIVLSNRTKDLIKNKYGIQEDKLWLIYNGLNDTIPEKKETLENKKNILFVGRLEDGKGIEYLLNAFKLIYTKYEDINLVIVGDGDFQKYLSQSRSLQGRINFLGKLTHDEIKEVYSKAYIGVIPSFNEQCSYTVIEMMQRGIPVIGTDMTGLAEMFVECPELCIHIDERNFDEENFIAEILSCIEHLCEDKASYTKESQIARRTFLKNYRLSEMLHNIDKVVYSSLKRTNYVVSFDYLKEMDARMMQIINMRPDIDTEFFGASGIGVYLWHRTLMTRKDKNQRMQSALLQEYLIYYLDWLYELAKESSLPEEIAPILQNMLNNKFYPSKVRRIISLAFSCGKETDHAITDEDILRNSLKICCTKL